MKRYNPYVSYSSEGYYSEMKESRVGEYVKYEDVQKLKEEIKEEIYNSYEITEKFRKMAWKIDEYLGNIIWKI